jgi:ADP-heptose:LPS heptosyltransferase
MNFEQIKEIAFVRRNGLGDLLMAMPLLSLCRERIPQAKVVLFVDERNAPLAAYLEGVDEVAVISQAGGKPWGLLRTALKFRSRHFDLAISAKPTPMRQVNLFLRLLGARQRRAYVGPGWDRWLINDPVQKSGEGAHHALQTLRLLEPELREVPRHLYPQLKGQFSPPPGFRLLVSVTNRRLGSLLDLERCAAVVNAVHARKPGFSVVICGEPFDRSRAQALQQLLTVPSEVVIPDGFDPFLRLLGSCHAAFVGDGGIMHLMAALDRPQLVLFGGTRVAEWAPLSDRAKILADPHNVNFISQEAMVESLEEVVR